MEAITSWQYKTSCKFPKWSQVLAILKELGYRRPGFEDKPPAKEVKLQNGIRGCHRKGTIDKLRKQLEEKVRT
jgi:hypothetical protein